ncbi:MAG: 1,4-dihydroxy-6-naphthoate synthase [Thermodesulfovibrionia bacterium]|nr:1,4-dihydroxy-6-naphthoate synthase [Thermodesulfovibrionia bacterium]
MKNLSLGYSPCPNDTFIFYAMVHGIINTPGFHINEVLLDVETLNQKALRSELDLSKISYHAFGNLRNEYCMLRSGGALGKGCGPLLIGAEEYSISEIKNKRIAIPGRLTTAYLLLQMFDPDFKIGKADISVMPFNEIIPAIKKGDVDAGLIIHESRFTYSSYGLKEIIDLGKWWEEETGLLLPLGGIIAKRELGAETINAIDKIIYLSIEFAFKNRNIVMRYIKEHAQELSEDVINRHIDLYVNKHSLDIGADGEKAVKELLLRAENAGIIPRSDVPLFI